MGNTQNMAGRMHPARAKTIMTPLMMYGGAIVGGLATAQVIRTAVPLMEAQNAGRAENHYLKSLMKKEFDAIDTSRTGTISLPEASAAGIDKEHFDQMDYNHDGVISFDEFVEGIKHNVMDGVQVKWGPAEQMRQAEMRGIDAVGLKHSVGEVR